MLLAPFISRLHRRLWVWVIAVVGAILGVLPDLLGGFGFILAHDEGELYRSAHWGAIKSVMQYVPMYWLHLFCDSYMHEPGRTWHGFHLRPTLEVLLWVANILLTVWFVRIWRRNFNYHSKGIN